MRCAYYSLGDPLDLALLDARVTTLMQEIDAAIPEIDPDAAAYIAEVEATDGEPLEPEVKTAYNSFVVGCKEDGIWDAIKASCIMAGARTLQGALIPLVGTAPTNLNFVESDYDRKTGLKGDGVTKYLLTNLSDKNDIGGTGNHFLIWQADGATELAGTAGHTTSGATRLYHTSGFPLRLRVRSSAFFDAVPTVSDAVLPLGSFGVARDVDTVYTFADNRLLDPQEAYPAQVFLEELDYVWRLYHSYTGHAVSSLRVAFYSIGEVVDLALLDARVSTLMSDLATALP
jgi:hypothetical protein